MTDDFTIDFIAASASADSGAPPNVGYSIRSEPTMDPDTGSNSGFGGQFSDFVVSRLYNGVFASGPPDPSANLDPSNSVSASNFMPNWRFVQSSNTNITAKQVRDIASPSGSNARFTFASGAAADAAFLEQIVDIGGSRLRAFSGRIRAFALRSSGTAAFSAFVETQLLDVDEAAIGDSAISTATPTTGTQFAHLIGGTAKMPPARARKLRIRVGVTRGAAATSATGSIDFCEVRVDSGQASYDLPERAAPDTYTPGYLVQQNGIVHLSPDTDGVLDGLPSLLIVGSGATTPGSGTGAILTDSLFRVASLPLQLTEIAAPSTPASGFYNVYPKTDGILYGKNDAGTELALGGGGAPVVFPATQVQSADANTLDDYEEGTFTPTVVLATPGTSSFAYSNQIGRYVKVGKWVTILIRVNGTLTIGTGSSTVRVGGLPFTSETVASTGPVLMVNMSGYTKAGYTQLGMTIGSASNFLATQGVGTGVAFAAIVAADVTAGGAIDYRISGSYETDG